MTHLAPAMLTFPAVADLQLQAAEGDGEKKLRRFTGTAYTGIKMQASGWAFPVVIDLAGMKVSAKSRPILRDHEFSRVIGHTEGDEGVSVSPRAIKVSGVISAANEHAREIVDSSDNGFPWQMSVGASVEKAVFIEEGETASVNGRKVSGPAYVIRQSVLNEVSFVALGADDNTSAKIAASAVNTLIGVIPMKFDDWLKAKGWGDGAAISDPQMKTLQAAYDAEQNPPKANGEEEAVEKIKSKGPQTSGSDMLDQAVSKRKSKELRDQRIAAVASEAINDRPGQLDQIEALARIAIEAETDPDKFELELLRNLRPQTGGLAGRRSAPQMTNSVIEAAMCSSGKLQNIEKRFDEQTLDLAHKHFPHGIGLAESLLIAARDRGCTHLSLANTREVLEAVFRQDIRAGGFSTISLPNILSNVANKFLMDAFNAVEAAWREITAIRSVRDFKQVTIHTLTGDYTYREVGASGEIQHAVPGEEVYTNQASTYARMLAITRRDLINDDLGAFTEVPRKLGRGGALAINTVFWTEFNDNSSFFTAGNANYDAGLNSVFDAAGLINADQIFRAQTDPDGNPLGSMPRILLVPPGDRIAAMRLMNSQQVLTASDAGSSNPFSGMFRVVSSVYMANTVIGGDTLAWYLLAEPSDLPVIETCFLNGREAPVIESADADFEQLGIKIRAYHDFGCNKMEYRAGVKMKGAT